MKKIIALLLALAMVFALAACGGNSKSDDAAPAADNSADSAPAAESDGDAAAPATGDGKLTGTLMLGEIGPTTGGAAMYGTAVSNAMKLAVEEINAIDPDFQIEFNPQDDEHDAEKSVNAYNTLKDWKVQVIGGTVTTTPCVAVAAEAFSDRVFMLTPSASSPTVTEGKDNMFQLCFSDTNQGTGAAQYIKENGLSEKVAVIYNNADAYSTGIYQTFKAKADEVGLSIVSTSTFTDDTKDFSVQIKDAQDNGADMIFLPMYYEPASLIMQQAASVGYQVNYFGVDGLDGILAIDGFDTSLAEGAMLLTPFAADATDEKTVAFVEKYQSTYNETPTQFAADGYDVAYAIYNALLYYAQNNGGLDVTGVSAEDMCAIMIQTFTDAGFSFSGVTGENMTWNAAGEVSKDPKAVKIVNGVYVGM